MASSKKTDPRVAKWNRWLEIIQRDIYELLMLRYVFWEVQKIIKHNHAIQTDSYFYEWLGLTYSKTASVGIRKQLDSKATVITLARLLCEIQQTPHLLTLADFESRYTNGYRNRTEHEKLFFGLQRKQAEKDFSLFSGSVRTHVDPSSICNDLIRLNMACKPIKKYVNKRIAHRDKKEFTAIPTFNDLDTAIELLFDTVKKYTLLLQCVQYDIVIEPQWDWKEIFAVPWIK